MNAISLTIVSLITAATAVFLSTQPAARPLVPQGAPSSAPVVRVPVVVELFTSEGCSSCPAADAALRELETAQSVPGIEVIAPGQHVDYWNRLDWKDLFSSAQFTERQRWYADAFHSGTYTPQVVVNGRYQFVGSQRPTLSQAVAQAAQAPRATVALARGADGTLNVQVRNLPADTQAATVQLALTERGLSSQVGRGENAGRRLQHAAVVRTLRLLGAVAADGTFSATVPLTLSAAWKTNNLKAVVLVQETASRHIVGVAALPMGSPKQN